LSIIYIALLQAKRIPNNIEHGPQNGGDINIETIDVDYPATRSLRVSGDTPFWRRSKRTEIYKLVSPFHKIPALEDIGSRD
jgi:hypothetical protein